MWSTSQYSGHLYLSSNSYNCTTSDLIGIATYFDFLLSLYIPIVIAIKAIIIKSFVVLLL